MHYGSANTALHSVQNIQATIKAEIFDNEYLAENYLSHHIKIGFFYFNFIQILSCSSKIFFNSSSFWSEGAYFGL